MHVTLAGVVLFLHISVAIIAFMMAGVLHAAFQVLARARDLREARSWAILLHRLDPLLPVSALVLLGLGAWLIHLSGGEFSWRDGWIITAVVSLVLIEGLAGALLAPKMKAIVGEIAHSSDGPISENLHRQIIDPISWHIGHIATFGFAGVVFLMAAKPSGAWSPVIVVIGAAIGVAVSAAQLRALPLSGAAVPDQRRQPAETA
ncbi:MAG: DUF2269 family protein [Acidothermaceae bacterium]